MKCPKCKEESEQLVVCPGCQINACVERCNTGGVGCLCPECEESGEF